MTDRGSRRNLAGTVVSNKNEKTAVVLVERLTKHQTYGKFIRTRSKYTAHDPKNECRVGDRVRIIESRPLSKRKRWQVIETLTRANIED